VAGHEVNHSQTSSADVRVQLYLFSPICCYNMGVVTRYDLYGLGFESQCGQ